MRNDWTVVTLEDFLKISRESTIVAPSKIYKQITVRLHHKGVVLREEKIGKLIKSKQFIAKTGQFIISRIDARNGAMGLVPNELDGAIVTNDFLLYDIDHKKVNPKYFGFLTRSKRFVEMCIKASKGTTNRVRLQPEKFLQIKIQIPKLDEQKQILSNVKVQLDTLEDTIKSREKAQEEFEEYIETIYREIFKKIEKDYGSDHIKNIEIEINPENINPSKEFGNDSFLYIDVSSIEKKTGKIIEKKKISGNNAPSRARRKMRKNDVVFGAVRPYLKKCFIVDENLDGNISSTGFTIFRIKNKNINSKFLKHQLISDFFIDQCLDAVTGAHYPALNDKKLRELKLTIPPSTLQNRIVKFMDHFHEDREQINSLYLKSLNEMEELLPLILNRTYPDQ